MNLDFLEEYNSENIGPIQKEDALLLYAVLKILCPKNIIEFGTQKGYSTKLFIKAMRDDAYLTTYDTDRLDKETQDKITHPRVKIINDSQENFSSTESVDFVFMDASHNLEINQKTFIKLLPLLTDNCIIAVHDTGTTKDEVSGHGYYLGEEFIHQPDERKFVNWIMETCNASAMNFHTLRERRYGMTLLQINKTLKV